MGDRAIEDRERLFDLRVKIVIIYIRYKVILISFRNPRESFLKVIFFVIGNTALPLNNRCERSFVTRRRYFSTENFYFLNFFVCLF